jgi:dihydrofolate synthase/folylpolyglutamate synthase
VSDAPSGGRFEAMVARLHALHPTLIDLSLDRVLRLLAALGHPERRLPRVIHVAGTNGKGSTCAFLRAIAEAAGLRAHVFTSPHLVSFNERIRIAGTLVDDDALADALARVEAANAGQAITVFEVITAAALLLFARHPADLCVLEVGLGGRLDATNVVDRPAAAAITSISIDHREFLGDTIAKIAREKAGIIKPDCPAVTGHQCQEAMDVLHARATECGVALRARGSAWRITPVTGTGTGAGGLRYEDAAGVLDLPLPGLPGAHQHDNAGIAVAALRASGLRLPDAAYAVGVAGACWPGRMQRLTGRLARAVPPGWELWLDGGHNVGAAVAIADHLRSWQDRPASVIVGMKNTKDAAGFLAPLLATGATLFAVTEPGQHLAMPVEAVVAASGGRAHAGPTVAEALARLPRTGAPGRALICGSLYLAGEVLKLDAATRPAAEGRPAGDAA